MTRLPALRCFLGASFDDLLAGAAQVLEDEAKRATPEYWADEAGYGDHARADDLPYQDTDAGMWESGE